MNKKIILFKVFGVFFAIMLFIVTLSLFNYFFIYTKKPKLSAYHSDTLTYHHEKLGTRLLKKKNVHIKKFIDNKKVSDFMLTTDLFGRRTVPTPENKINKFALFFGGSHSYGEGVEDNQTYPYFFQVLAKEYRSYIYAFSGYGPQQMLAFTEVENLKSQIIEDNGIIIYTWSTGHLERLLGVPKVINWTKTWPYYKKDKNNYIIHHGFFNTDRFIKTKYYQLLNFFGFNDYSFSKKEYRFMCDIINKAKSNLSSQFPKADFITIAHPLKRDQLIFKEISLCLSELKIPVYDLKDVLNLYPKDKLIIKGDGHFNPLGNKVMAKKAYEKLMNERKL